jgi:hypothetical protein
METKKGGFKKKFDSFPQTSLNFVGISHGNGSHFEKNQPLRA